MKTKWAAIYENARCPDCGQLIPKRAVEGDACKNCGHVFTLPHKCDDAECTVTFTVSGYVRQSVTIIDGRVTPRSLEDGLRTGKYFTTVQEGEDICDVHGRAVARVESLSTKSELEYQDFEVE